MSRGGRRRRDAERRKAAAKGDVRSWHAPTPLPPFLPSAMPKKLAPGQRTHRIPRPG